LNTILDVANDTKPLDSLLLYHLSIQFLSQKQKIIIKKKQIWDRTRESDFRRRCFKEEKL